MRMNQKTALSDAQPQPSASSSPNSARRAAASFPAASACCAIVLHPSGRRHARRHGRGRRRLDRQGSRHVVGWTWQSNVYVPGRERRDRYVLPSAAEEPVSPLRPDGPSESLISTLWGAVASWLSNFEAERLVGRRLERRRVEAVDVRAAGRRDRRRPAAFGSTEAPGAAEPPAPPPVERVGPAVRERASRPAPACSSDRPSP